MTNTQTQKQQTVKTESELTDQSHLIVFNDDENTFDWVIICFVEVCKLDTDEAIEKTLYIHYNGKGVVRSGDYQTMNEMKNQLNERGLIATVVRPELN